MKTTTRNPSATCLYALPWKWQNSHFPPADKNNNNYNNNNPIDEGDEDDIPSVDTRLLELRDELTLIEQALDEMEDPEFFQQLKLQQELWEKTKNNRPRQPSNPRVQTTTTRRNTKKFTTNPPEQERRQYLSRQQREQKPTRQQQARQQQQSQSFFRSTPSRTRTTKKAATTRTSMSPEPPQVPPSLGTVTTASYDACAEVWDDLAWYWEDLTRMLAELELFFHEEASNSFEIDNIQLTLDIYKRAKSCTGRLLEIQEQLTALEKRSKRKSPRPPSVKLPDPAEVGRFMDGVTENLAQAIAMAAKTQRSAVVLASDVVHVLNDISNRIESDVEDVSHFVAVTTGNLTKAARFVARTTGNIAQAVTETTGNISKAIADTAKKAQPIVHELRTMGYAKASERSQQRRSVGAIHSFDMEESLDEIAQDIRKLWRGGGGGGGGGGSRRRPVNNINQGRNSSKGTTSKKRPTTTMRRRRRRREEPTNESRSRTSWEETPVATNPDEPRYNRPSRLDQGTYFANGEEPSPGPGNDWYDASSGRPSSRRKRTPDNTSDQFAPYNRASPAGKSRTVDSRQSLEQFASMYNKLPPPQEKRTFDDDDDDKPKSWGQSAPFNRSPSPQEKRMFDKQRDTSQFTPFNKSPSPQEKRMFDKQRNSSQLTPFNKSPQSQEKRTVDQSQTLGQFAPFSRSPPQEESMREKSLGSEPFVPFNKSPSQEEEEERPPENSQTKPQFSPPFNRSPSQEEKSTREKPWSSGAFAPFDTSPLKEEEEKTTREDKLGSLGQFTPFNRPPAQEDKEESLREKPSNKGQFSPFNRTPPQEENSTREKSQASGPFVPFNRSPSQEEKSSREKSQSNGQFSPFNRSPSQEEKRTFDDKPPPFMRSPPQEQKSTSEKSPGSGPFVPFNRSPAQEEESTREKSQSNEQFSPFNRSPAQEEKTPQKKPWSSSQFPPVNGSPLQEEEKRTRDDPRNSGPFSPPSQKEESARDKPRSGQFAPFNRPPTREEKRMRDERQRDEQFAPSKEENIYEDPRSSEQFAPYNRSPFVEKTTFDDQQSSGQVESSPPPPPEQFMTGEPINGEVQRDSQERITICVMDQSGHQSFYQIRLGTRMEKVLEMHAQQKEVQTSGLRFQLEVQQGEGYDIKPHDTALSLGLQDGDEVSCINIGDSISIRVQDHFGNKIASFEIPRTAPMSKLFAMCAERKGEQVESLRFFMDANEEIEPSSTPETIGLEDGKLVTCIGDNDPVIITISDQLGEEKFKIKKSTQMAKLFELYASGKGVQTDSLRFMLEDGKDIDPEQTPVTLNLDHGGTIRCGLSTQLIFLKVRNAVGEDSFFRIKRSTRMSKLFDMYAHLKGVQVQSLHFTLADGSHINPAHSPSSLKLEDEDRIYCTFANQKLSRQQVQQEQEGVLPSPTEPVEPSPGFFSQPVPNENTVPSIREQLEREQLSRDLNRQRCRSSPESTSGHRFQGGTTPSPLGQVAGGTPSSWNAPDMEDRRYTPPAGMQGLFRSQDAPSDQGAANSPPENQSLDSNENISPVSSQDTKPWFQTGGSPPPLDPINGDSSSLVSKRNLGQIPDTPKFQFPPKTYSWDGNIPSPPARTTDYSSLTKSNQDRIVPPFSSETANVSVQDGNASSSFVGFPSEDADLNHDESMTPTEPQDLKPHFRMGDTRTPYSELNDSSLENPGLDGNKGISKSTSDGSNEDYFGVRDTPSGLGESNAYDSSPQNFGLNSNESISPMSTKDLNARFRVGRSFSPLDRGTDGPSWRNPGPSCNEEGNQSSPEESRAELRHPPLGGNVRDRSSLNPGLDSNERIPAFSSNEPFRNGDSSPPLDGATDSSSLNNSGLKWNEGKPQYSSEMLNGRFYDRDSASPLGEGSASHVPSENADLEWNESISPMSPRDLDARFQVGDSSSPLDRAADDSSLKRSDTTRIADMSQDSMQGLNERFQGRGAPSSLGGGKMPEFPSSNNDLDWNESISPMTPEDRNARFRIGDSSSTDRFTFESSSQSRGTHREANLSELDRSNESFQTGDSPPTLGGVGVPGHGGNMDWNKDMSRQDLNARFRLGDSDSPLEFPSEGVNGFSKGGDALFPKNDTDWNADTSQLSSTRADGLFGGEDPLDGVNGHAHPSQSRLLGIESHSPMSSPDMNGKEDVGVDQKPSVFRSGATSKDDSVETRGVTASGPDQSDSAARIETLKKRVEQMRQQKSQRKAQLLRQVNGAARSTGLQGHIPGSRFSVDQHSSPQAGNDWDEDDHR